MLTSAVLQTGTGGNGAFHFSLLLVCRQTIIAFNAFLDGFARLADVAVHSKGNIHVLY